jgi:hypothetical protein
MLVVIALVGCGRIGFDASTGGPNGTGDAFADAGGAGGGDGGGDGGGQPAGFTTCNPPCDLGQTGRDDDGICGGAGTCVMPSASLPLCQDIEDPVCGCTGITYTNDCHLTESGDVKAHDGPCGTNM